MIYSACIIGTGNLAHHLAPALDQLSMISVESIISRNFQHAEKMAEQFSAKALKGVKDIPRNTQIVFIWTNDDSIEAISKELASCISSETIIIHSSGLKPVNAIDAFFQNKGVLWPIQSISRKDKNLNISEIPFCITTSNEMVQKIIKEMAKALSDHIYIVNDHQKAIIHLTSIISNNFSNHLFNISKRLLEQNNLPFELILPLITKTAEKVKIMDPSDAQTGPAIREDAETMDAHLALISEDESLINIYQEISRSIINYKRK